MTMKIKRYSELFRLKTFSERFEYLKLGGDVGKETFGHERYLNQRFYASKEWEDLRRHVIVRDLGCDLGVLGYEIQGRIYVHHMNPVTTKDLVVSSDILLKPEFLICVSFETHNAIHYGSEPKEYEIIERTSGDTKLW